jgi:hypothetical protein
MKIMESYQGREYIQTFDLRVGDIVQFDAQEILAAESGGVGLILMRYKVTGR